MAGNGIISVLSRAQSEDNLAGLYAEHGISAMQRFWGYMLSHALISKTIVAAQPEDGLYVLLVPKATLKKDDEEVQREIEAYLQSVEESILKRGGDTTYVAVISLNDVYNRGESLAWPAEAMAGMLESGAIFTMINIDVSWLYDYISRVASSMGISVVTPKDEALSLRTIKVRTTDFNATLKLDPLVKEFALQGLTKEFVHAKLQRMIDSGGAEIEKEALDYSQTKVARE